MRAWPWFLRSVGCACVAAILVAGSIIVSRSGGKTKLSEGSHQVAYPAGIGARQLAVAQVPRLLPKGAVSCAAAARAIGSASVAYAAVVKGEAVIRRQPQGRSAIVARAERLNGHGFRDVLSVIGVHAGASCRPDWYRVELPVLPNGTTGWVRAWAVKTYRVRSRIVIDVSDRRLRLFRSGALVFATRVTVGAAATPTPLGRFFVNERYVLRDASGPFGPNALGISAHSDVLQHVWVEDGPIGIHGTNEPWSIGQAASHGCIRVANTVMRRLFPLVPAGTPVVVEA